MSAMPSGNCSPDKVISEPCRPPWNPRLPGNRPLGTRQRASGGIALLAAMADLESGRYDVALVLGAELERTVPGDLAADHMGAAAWVGRDAQGAKYVWPWSFSALADEYERRYGLDDAHLRAIGELNLSNAKRNPFAQTRKWSFTGDSFAADDVANPIVEDVCGATTAAR